MRKLNSELEHLKTIDDKESPAAGLAVALMVFVSKHYDSKTLEIALEKLGYVKENVDGKKRSDRRILSGENW